jgi:predicted patatin/cPLA2 family phospholipase
MRGSVAGGMISALQALGLSRAFDVVAGTSAGAIAASYFLANQASLGSRIYYEDLTDRRWINYLRPAVGKPLLDFSYIFDMIVSHTKKLDTKAALESGSRLLITATRKSDWTGAIIEPDSPDELILALQASTRIPLAGGAPVRIDDQYYFDGALSVSIPFSIALGQAPTHALVLLTHPAGESIERRDGAYRMWWPRALDLLYPGLGRAHSLRHGRYLEELHNIQQARSSQIEVVRPSKDEPVVGLLEQDPYRLYQGAKAGAKAVFGALGAVPSGQELDRLLHKPGATAGR